jgi:23S rRNA pseudouridine2604 synthase
MARPFSHIRLMHASVEFKGRYVDKIILFQYNQSMQKTPSFPMRINKYLAEKGFSTRLGGDELVRRGKVLVNGKPAVLGMKVAETDVVEVINVAPKRYLYFAYHKPVGLATEDIEFPGVFPIGRLDKDSRGLLILTDDGRITDRLLNPERDHEKEYVVRTADKLPSNIKKRMESGVDIEGYITKKCSVTVLNETSFKIILTEGKKHQIRRMCDALGLHIRDLQRTRIMNIKLGDLPAGERRPIDGRELADFLASIGL